MGRPRKPDPIKFCKACGDVFERAVYKNTLEDRQRFLAREHCSQSCANKRVDVTDAAYRWRAAQHRGTACAECGAATDLHAHHHNRDITDNREENIQTLCASCHLRLHWREDRDQRMAAQHRA